ncbi:hypothetical protein AAVH_19947 [Aphelenchoides avenae]|nr:hypothetical protein AAVH_19947 [Aphelenchus avenae]
MASGARIFVAASMLAATVLAATPWFELSRVGKMWITRSSISGPDRFDLETYTFFEVSTYLDQ